MKIKHMSSKLKKFVKFNGLLFWIDLETPTFLVVNPDGTSRKATTKDATFGEILSEAPTVPEAEINNIVPEAFLKSPAYTG